MSKFKGTPGPWFVNNLPGRDCEPDTDGSLHAETHVTAYDPKEGATLAWVNRWAYNDDPPTPESVANARLIAAAPDLLASLVELLPHARRDVERLVEQMVGNLYPNILLAAIARAEGAVKKALGDT